MTSFTFPHDEEGGAFGHSIAREMVRLFSISEEEAVKRINRAWKHAKLVKPDHVFYHEDELYWANDIYYGHNSMWWQSPPGLTPQPPP